MAQKSESKVALGVAGHDDLTSVRNAAQYDKDEEQFSAVLRDRLTKLLRGEENRLPLMRKYHRDANRLGVMGSASIVNRRALRLPIVEQMLRDTLLFLHDGTPGSAPARERDNQARIVELQEFTTKWPHILLFRRDVFDGETGAPLETYWYACRVQNQRAQIRINRLLDVASLGLELVRVIGIVR